MVETTQRKLAERIEDTNRRNEELQKLLDLQRQTLHQLSGLSREEATRRLLEMLDNELQNEQGAMIQKHESKMPEIAEAKSREILVTAIQRYAAGHTAETTTSTVDIPNDEMKGRIIGREGRNIRAFEKATGVDVIIDDTPGVVIVSGFDPVRREIARMALGKLIADGRIHPSRIEEVVAETQTEMEGTSRNSARKRRRKPTWPAASQSHSPAGPAAVPHQLQPERAAAFDRSGVSDRHAGRGSWAWMASWPAAAACCTTSARRPTTRPKGPSQDRRRIAQALWRRAGSGARGAGPSRRHSHRSSLHGAGGRGRCVQCLASRRPARNVGTLHQADGGIGNDRHGFPGVEQAFAIQAGRELRVIANSKDTTDESAAKICRDIANAFEQQLTYPGEIKVTMIRETRMTELAR